MALAHAPEARYLWHRTRGARAFSEEGAVTALMDHQGSASTRGRRVSTGDARGGGLRRRGGGQSQRCEDKGGAARGVPGVELARATTLTSEVSSAPPSAAGEPP